MHVVLQHGMGAWYGGMVWGPWYGGMVRGPWKCRKDDIFELKSAYIVNALINVKLRNTCSLFYWFTVVEVTSRCACCPIVRTCKYLLFSFIYPGDHIPGPS